jgi:UDP-N-acetylglucosamine 2-epimerase (non-hydrolysing)
MKSRPLRLMLVGGARPNFMKIAPLLRAFRARPSRFDARLVHTGQHYDAAMSGVFFEELDLPEPDIHLGAGSATHAVQTARIMEAFEKVLLAERPDWVIVVGDVNSTVACSLVATKMSPPVPVAHVEAGLRSRDRTMPEEINRVITDTLSDLLFTTSADADRNLRAEGIDRRRIHRVGNLMIDTLRRHLRSADGAAVMREHGIARPFALLTLHRPSNVDDPDALRRIFGALEEVGRDLPIIFPVHPRTVKTLRDFGLGHLNDRNGSAVRHIQPLGYLDFLHLQKRAALVLTDSGGIQEEASILGVPCLTLRDNTERPVTITHGTNRLVGTDPDRIVAAARRVLRRPTRRKRTIPLWDGRAAARIVKVFSHLAREAR